MKTSFKNLFFLLAGLFLFGCEQNLVDNEFFPEGEQLISTRLAGPSANGQGGLIIFDRLAHFSFHAQVEADGSVRGSWEANSPAQEVRTHGDIICLEVNGNTAVMAGVITEVKEGANSSFNIRVGDYIWFKVADNGEGKKAEPDQFTDYYLHGSEFPTCNDRPRRLRHIAYGNIQVKE